MAKYPKDKRPPPTPKKANPWDMPALPTKGDSTAETLYAAIGLALTNWAHLEDTLAAIFSTLVSPTHGEVAFRAFGSILTFRGKKEMIEAAAEAFFFQYPDPEGNVEPHVKALLHEAEKFAARRNEIAHGIVQENTRQIARSPFGRLGGKSGLFPHPPTPPPDPKYPVGFVLRPTDHTSKKTTMVKGRIILLPVIYVPDYVYASPEVLALAAHFDRIQKFAIRFPLAILGHWDKERERAFP